MTDLQKKIIFTMRKQKATYATIADALGLSINTVKSFCYRNGINTTDTNDDGVCLCCGKTLAVSNSHRPRKFCSDRCKSTWWNARRYARQSEKMVTVVCSVCGTTFTDYASTNRKFCSQACYRKRGEQYDQ